MCELCIPNSLLIVSTCLSHSVISSSSSSSNVLYVYYMCFPLLLFIIYIAWVTKNATLLRFESHTPEKSIASCPPRKNLACTENYTSNASL